MAPKGTNVSVGPWWALNVIDSIPVDTLSADHALSPNHPHAQVSFYQDIKKIIEQLLEHEADINMPDLLGTTPLHIMARYNLYEIAEAILKKHCILLEAPAGDYQERP